MIDTIRKIYNHLLLNIAYVNNPGLYSGKTGCLLFFAHYAKLYDDKVNDEIVSEIIDDIFSTVGKISELNIPDGVCGVGWGVEYILQNQLMEGDSDEILADLDKMIFSRDIKTITSQADFSDIIKYAAIRLTSSCGGSKNIPFPRNYLLELYQAAKHPARIPDFAANNDLNVIKKVLEKGRFRRNPLCLAPEMTGHASIEEFPFISLGLHKGLSGFGIKLMIESCNKQ